MSAFLRPTARGDIAEIAKYIANENPMAARNWRRDMLESCRMLGEFPHLGTARDDLKPCLRTFPKGNYIIVFRTNGSDAVILRVIHSARDWLELIPAERY